MLRVRLSTGEEAVFRDTQEFEQAVRQRVVTAEALIFHAPTGQWLPVQRHPAYQGAVAKGPVLSPLVIERPDVAPAPLLAPTPRYAEPRELPADATAGPRVSGGSGLLILLLAIASVAGMVALAVWRPWESALH